MDRRVKGATDVDDDGDGDSWEECDLDGGNMGFLMVDDDDIAVRVGQDDQNFQCLMPGDSWTTSVPFQSDQYDELSNYIPDDSHDVVPGDRFRFRFKGVVVDWWDWGTMEEHADTIVKLPSFIAGRVTDPADNGGRPKLIVPASEAVQFIYTA